MSVWEVMQGSNYTNLVIIIVSIIIKFASV